MNAEDFLLEKENNTKAYIPYRRVIKLMEEFAVKKAKEAAKNVRHQAVEIINDETFDAREKGEPLPSVGDLCEWLENKIMNIQWRDVSPFNDTIKPYSWKLL